MSIFWPGEFHELHIPWGCKELDKTEKADIKVEDVTGWGQVTNSKRVACRCSLCPRHLWQQCAHHKEE